MKQKVIKIGNSEGIIIPKKVREEVGLKLGDSVAVEHTFGDESIVISKKGRKQVTSSASPNLQRFLKKVNKKYAVALKELAGK